MRFEACKATGVISLMSSVVLQFGRLVGPYIISTRSTEWWRVGVRAETRVVSLGSIVGHRFNVWAEEGVISLQSLNFYHYHYQNCLLYYLDYVVNEGLLRTVRTGAAAVGVLVRRGPLIIGVIGLHAGLLRYSPGRDKAFDVGLTVK